MRTRIALGVAAVVLGTCGGVLAADPPVSRFLSGVEGWSLEGNVDWVWSGNVGNPPGALIAVVAGFEPMVFRAPGRFLGDQSAAFGGTISYDLRTDAADGSFPLQPDVTLTGAGLTLVVTLPTPRVNTWETRSVPLHPRGGWRVGAVNGRVATEGELRAVLGSLTSIIVRGNYAARVHGCWFDNAAITGCPTDFNRDGRLDSDDFFDFLNSYLAGGC